MITIIMIIMMHVRTYIEVNSWTFCMRSSKSRGYAGKLFRLGKLMLGSTHSSMTHKLSMASRGGLCSSGDRGESRASVIKMT